MYDKTPFVPNSNPLLPRSVINSQQTVNSIGPKIHAGAMTLQKMAGTANEAYDAGMQLYNIGRAVAPLIAPLFI